MNTAILERWKKAVIHLEAAGDSVSYSKRTRSWQELTELFQQGKISIERLAEGYGHGGRDVRCRGTAVFLEHEGRRYLVTARHVLHDKRSMQHQIEEADERAQESLARGDSPKDVEWRRQQDLQLATENAATNIYSVVFRVPTLDEALALHPEFHIEALTDLQVGPPDTVPYTFSEEALDLAIVSLDQRDPRFADELQRLGYEPIHLRDIADGPSAEGAEIFAVGYPGATAVRGERSLDPATAHWVSDAYSLPTFAFGRVSMSHEALNFFWGDISIYPGNSGGPVVEGDKLIGIVSGQAYIPTETKKDKVRIPFGSIIKAKYLRPLLEEQIRKDGFVQPQEM